MVNSDENVPEGTVQSRIRRLRRLAELTLASASPVPEHERDGERSGWGTKVGAQAQFVRPATHNTELGDHATAKSLSNSDEPFHTPDILGDDIMGDGFTLASTTATQIKSSTPAATRDAQTGSASPTGRRRAARELFEQYHVSRPSG